MKLNLDLFKNPVPIFIEIRGRNLLHAEGYCRIEDYSETKVVLSSRESTFAVHGENLTLRHLTDQRVAIEGRIDSFEFI